MNDEERRKSIEEFLEKKEDILEGRFPKFGVYWKIGDDALYVEILKKSWFSWMWFFVLVVKVIYQYHQFQKSFPNPNSLAFKLSGILFDIMVFFDRILGRKIKPQIEDEKVLKE